MTSYNNIYSLRHLWAGSTNAVLPIRSGNPDLGPDPDFSAKNSPEIVRFSPKSPDFKKNMCLTLTFITFYQDMSGNKSPYIYFFLFMHKSFDERVLQLQTYHHRSRHIYHLPKIKTKTFWNYTSLHCISKLISFKDLKINIYTSTSNNLSSNIYANRIPLK